MKKKDPTKAGGNIYSHEPKKTSLKGTVIENIQRRACASAAKEKKGCQKDLEGGGKKTKPRGKR